MTPPIVAFTTDFGDLDGYVAQMKGVVLSAVPTATLVDVTHRVPPQDVVRAAGVLEDVVEAFPPGTVHVAVVDPGVGTQRPIVAVESVGQRFVAPDNGVLSHVVERHGAKLVVECTEPEFWRADVSHTFHGRDVMSPLAAHWVAGTDPRRFGVVRDDLSVRLPPSQPVVDESSVRGRVMWADHFGNLITNVRIDDLPVEPPGCRVTLGDGTRVPVHATYGTAEPGSVLALIGSSGRLEVAVNGGSAAERFAWSRESETTVFVEREPADG